MSDKLSIPKSQYDYENDENRQLLEQQNRYKILKNNLKCLVILNFFPFIGFLFSLCYYK